MTSVAGAGVGTAVEVSRYITSNSARQPLPAQIKVSL